MWETNVKGETDHRINVKDYSHHTFKREWTFEEAKRHASSINAQKDLERKAQAAKTFAEKIETEKKIVSAPKIYRNEKRGRCL